MDRFEVILSGQAEKFYKKMPAELCHRLNHCFETLETNPYQGPHIKLLKTKRSLRWYRYRVGDYRVIYEIDNEHKHVGVLLVLHRSSAYRGI